MSARIRHRVAVLLVCVLAFTGSAAASGACSHGGGDASLAATPGHAGHANHEGHATPPGTPADPGADGSDDIDTPAAGGCECGCPCAGNCSQGCQTPAPVTAATDSSANIATALPAVARGVLLHSSTHPPLRPPAALT